MYVFYYTSHLPILFLIFFFRVSCQCISIILGMSEYNKMRLLHKYFSNEQHYQYLVEYELDRQSADFSLTSDAGMYINTYIYYFLKSLLFF